MENQGICHFPFVIFHFPFGIKVILALKMKNDLFCTNKGATRFPSSHLSTALLLAHLFVGGDSFEPNAAICSSSFNGRSAGAQVKRNLLRQAPLNSYWKIDIDASIHRPSF
jgi:hypothetical protein